MRGKKLPQTILTDKDVRQILAAKEKRDRLRAMITDRYSNESLAKIFGVSERCIERAMARETHGTVA